MLIPPDLSCRLVWDAKAFSQKVQWERATRITTADTILQEDTQLISQSDHTQLTEHHNNLTCHIQHAVRLPGDAR